ncbi:LysR family transcriptional regulator [Pseudoduganella albidiflava]|uniref:LysR family transcriptional regulator n=1 Tax=Pseudoduganella albidiflava TaxID=321983 RepID=A0A411X2Q9_9BURK|nr:LysR family transcriptional regulator [Pseudoduganella albidiflava]QBI03224.1 LysR family transcriptional regulator [Pseudoduganella albidiflava]GGY68920.1 LysR family transcriptional regulator [Pseudoduganella albidiflava]
MDQVHLMNVFVAVGEEEGFAAAARRLDLSPAAVTRAIAGLEEQLGVRLLMRTTRNVRLTEAGQRYLDDSRSILASIEEANEAAAGVNSAPKGNLSVTASVLFGKMFVMPCILRYLNEFPQVEVSALFLDRVVNLVDEGIDVAVRIGHLPDSSLKALRVGQVRRVLCAAPDYLARHGMPQHPADLLRHTIVAAAGISPRVEWKFGAVDDPTLVRLRPRLTVSSNDAAIEAAVSGLGICRLLSYQVAEDVKADRLRIILADYEEAPWPVHLVHRESKFGSSKVRKFIDLLAEHLRAHQHLQ